MITCCANCKYATIRKFPLNIKCNNLDTGFGKVESFFFCDNLERDDTE